MHLEADLRWLDIVEQRLDEIKRQPAPVPSPSSAAGRRRYWQGHKERHCPAVPDNEE